MSESPGVILLAVYRPEPTLLRRQLESIANQSLEQWMCIIGIDGADGDTASRISRIIGCDPRFQLMEFPDRVGVYRQFERLLGMVDEDSAWIALSDQDDCWHHAKLEILVAALDRFGVTGAACQARVVTATGRELGRTARRHKALAPLLIFNEVTGSLSIFRPEVLTLALPFPQHSTAAIHDHWLGVCATAMRGFHITQEVLQDYVQHAGNAIGERPASQATRAAAADIVRRRTGFKKFTTDPWTWRVSMARTLVRRSQSSDSAALKAIANGKMTPTIARFMFDEVRSRRIPATWALAMCIGALERSREFPLLRGRQASRGEEAGSPMLRSGP